MENIDIFIEGNGCIYSNDLVDTPSDTNSYLLDKDLTKITFEELENSPLTENQTDSLSNEQPVTTSPSVNLVNYASDEDPSNDFEIETLTKRGTKRKRRLYKSSLPVR